MISTIHQLRIDCWKDTQNKCKNLKIVTPSIQMKHIKNFNQISCKRYENSTLFFYNMDTIDCALHFENPLVLNLASDYHPGGGVAKGSGAQEESLFRRSNYFQTLTKQYYPIFDGYAIYSPNVSIIKQNETNRWLPYDINANLKLHFIACPGLRHPKTIKINNKILLNDYDKNRLVTKIETIIQCAIKYNHDTIVFGALGCGVWKNPPDHIANIFKEVLTKYNGVIKNYVFAILGTNTNNNSFYKINSQMDNNIDIFIKVFGRSTVDLF